MRSELVTHSLLSRSQPLTELWWRPEDRRSTATELSMMYVFLCIEIRRRPKDWRISENGVGVRETRIQDPLSRPRNSFVSSHYYELEQNDKKDPPRQTSAHAVRIIEERLFVLLSVRLNSDPVHLLSLIKCVVALLATASCHQNQITHPSPEKRRIQKVVFLRRSTPTSKRVDLNPCFRDLSTAEDESLLDSLSWRRLVCLCISEFNVDTLKRLVSWMLNGCEAIVLQSWYNGSTTSFLFSWYYCCWKC